MQLSEVREYVAVAVIVSDADFVMVPAVATSVATCAGVEVVVLTENDEDVRPHETVTVEGNVKPVAVVDNLTGKPVKGAAEVTETTHVKEAPTATLAGVQVKVLSDCPIATAPNVASSRPNFMEQNTSGKGLI